MLWSAGNKKKISWQFYWLIRSAADDKWQIGLGPSAVRQSPEFCKQLKVQPSSLNDINCQVTDTSPELGGWSYSKSEIAGAGKDLQRLLLSQFILDTGELRPRFPKGTWDPDLLLVQPVSLPCHLPFFSIVQLPKPPCHCPPSLCTPVLLCRDAGGNCWDCVSPWNPVCSSLDVPRTEFSSLKFRGGNSVLIPRIFSPQLRKGFFILFCFFCCCFFVWPPEVIEHWAKNVSSSNSRAHPGLAWEGQRTMVSSDLSWLLIQMAAASCCSRNSNKYYWGPSVQIVPIALGAYILDGI